MNCVFNGELERSKLYKNVFISQSPADLGNSIGSALFVEYVINKSKRKTYKQKLYSGKKTELDIDKKLEKYQIHFEKFINEDKLVERIIDYLLRDKIVALYNDKSEFGERALGARSFISMANKFEMKELINSKIIYREDYRPFAPICLQRNASKYFLVDDNYNCFSMEKVVKVREDFIKKLPAICHFDTSARLQTLDNESNLLIARILRYLENNNFIPVLINTSFNLNGEPNVENMDDAIRTFYTSGLDHLVLENNVLSK